jgi:uncharacterized membrane protein (DUF485 family)
VADKKLSDLSPQEHARLAHLVMRRQASLSVQVAMIFVILLFGLPLLNAKMPDIAQADLAGFPLTWLFLGVLIYPITVLLSFYFVRQSDRIESECADWRAVLGIEAGEPIEPSGVGDVKPAFIEQDLPEGETR